MLYPSEISDENLALMVKILIFYPLVDILLFPVWVFLTKSLLLFLRILIFSAHYVTF